MKLYRVILPVTNIDKAASFYAEIFDQKGERVSPGRHYFNLSGIVLACYCPEADGDNPQEKWSLHPNQYIYIAVEDLNQIHLRASSAGAKNVEPISKMPWGETLFYANDPFGNPICFVDNKTLFIGS